jgi:hypothetical protein
VSWLCGGSCRLVPRPPLPRPHCGRCSGIATGSSVEKRNWPCGRSRAFPANHSSQRIPRAISPVRTALRILTTLCAAAAARTCSNHAAESGNRHHSRAAAAPRGRAGPRPAADIQTAGAESRASPPDRAAACSLPADPAHGSSRRPSARRDRRCLPRVTRPTPIPLRSPAPSRPRAARGTVVQTVLKLTSCFQSRYWLGQEDVMRSADEPADRPPPRPTRNS